MCSDIKHNSNEIYISSQDESGIVGYGSFGAVRDCFHRKFGRVAVKCISINGTTSKIEEINSNMTDALRFLVHFNHPRLVPLFGISVWSSNVAIISQFMAGGNLNDFLSTSQIRIEWLLRLRMAVDIVSGLAYLHNMQDKPRVHGNLKPENILLDEDLRCKVADFGLNDLITSCGATSSVQNGPNNQNAILYTAPELLNDITMKYTTAMDIYSLSMIFYEILARSRVYHKTPGHIMLLASSIITKGQRPDQDILATIRNSLKASQPKDIEVFDLLRMLMVEAWDQNPSYRPNVDKIRDDLTRFGAKFNNVDFAEAASLALQSRKEGCYCCDMGRMRTLQDVFRSVEIVPTVTSTPTESEAGWNYPSLSSSPSSSSSSTVRSTSNENQSEDPSIIFFVTNDVEQCGVYRFIPKSKSFVELPKLYWEWNNSSAVVLEKTLYVIGANSVFSLRLGKKIENWGSSAPMLTARSHAAAVTLGGKIYVFGGIDPNHKPLSSVEVYDAKSNTWTQAGKLRKRRFGHSAMAYQGKIYCVGGANVNVECYDPIAKVTTVVTRTPNRNGFSAVISDGIIFDMGRRAKSNSAQGGSIKSQTIHFNIDCYNIKSDIWYREDDHKTDRSQGCACAVGNKIYFLGSFCRSTATSMHFIEAYDVKMKCWKTITKMDHGFVKHVCNESTE